MAVVVVLMAVVVVLTAVVEWLYFVLQFQLSLGEAFCLPVAVFDFAYVQHGLAAPSPLFLSAYWLKQIITMLVNALVK